MFESWLPKSKDHLPLTWWKQHPVYLASLVAIAGAVSMLIFAILGSGVMQHFVFQVDALLKGLLWTPLTYVWVNPPSLWTLFGCYLLWSFGEGVERHLGRRAFVGLLLLLLVISPALITAVHLAGAAGRACAGLMQLEFGVFIAFATLYPRAKINLILLTLDAWILAAVITGIYALQCLAARDWVSLLLLSGNVGAAFAFVRYQQGELQMPSFPQPFASSRERESASDVTTTASLRSTIDDILDKISREGIHSLTAKERKLLERASKDLKRRK